MKQLLLLLLVVLHLGCADGTDPPKQTRPNIILFITDDQGWGDLSFSGNPNLKTPHTDSIAMQGVSFDNFYVQPVCSPTRAEILTGQYFPRLGVYSTSAGGERMAPGVSSIAEAFQDAGYKTAAFGKWHNGSQPPYHPNSRGFETFYGFTSGHWGNYFSPMLEKNGEPVQGKGFLPDDLTSKAMDFIADSEGHPFFVYLAYNTPHSPMQVPESYWEKFRNHPLDSLSGAEEDLQFTRAALAMVSNIDDNIGRMTRYLEQQQLTENTLLVFLSDNGPNSFRWNGGMKGRKGSTDEGGVRSPLFLKWPGKITEGKRIDRIAGSIDLFPTLSGLAGLDGKSSEHDGLDLSPLILEQQEEWEDRAIFNAWGDRVSVRTQDFRLDDNGQLFRISTDRGQTLDVSTEFPELRDSLLLLRKEWITETGFEDTLAEVPFTIGHEEGGYTHLPARDAEYTGNIERSNRYPNSSFLTNWNSTGDYIFWDTQISEPGRYQAIVYYSCAEGDTGAVLQLECGGEHLTKKVLQAHDPPLSGMEYDRYPRMESYVKDFKPLDMGELSLPQGRNTLYLKALQQEGDGLIDFRLLVLKRLP